MVHVLYVLKPLIKERERSGVKHKSSYETKTNDALQGPTVMKGCLE